MIKITQSYCTKIHIVMGLKDFQIIKDGYLLTTFQLNEQTGELNFVRLHGKENIKV